MTDTGWTEIPPAIGGGGASASPRAAIEGRVVAYDGDCGMCRGFVGLLDRLALVPRERARPFQSFEGELARRLVAANVRNELAVWDPNTDEIRSGFDGLVWASEGSWADPLIPLTRPAPVRALLRHAYRVVAYNRRVIAPLQTSSAPAACEPDFHPGYRWSFIGMGAAAALLAAWGLASALGAERPAVGPWAVLAGPACLGLGALGRRGQGWVTWLGHQVVVAFLGLALLVPAAPIVHSLPGGWPLGVVALAVVAGACTMAVATGDRVRGLGLGPGRRRLALATLILGMGLGAAVAQALGAGW